jgi:hypothetical protein
VEIRARRVRANVYDDRVRHACEIIGPILDVTRRHTDACSPYNTLQCSQRARRFKAGFEMSACQYEIEHIYFSQ